MTIWKLFRLLWKLYLAYVGGGLTNAMIVHGPPGAGYTGLFDDLLVIAFKGLFDFTMKEAFAITVFTGELRKIIEDGEEYHQASERSRAQIRWQVDHHPQFAEFGPYLYGRISVEDALWLAWSARTLRDSEAVASAFQAVTDIFAVVGDVADVALL